MNSPTSPLALPAAAALPQSSRLRLSHPVTELADLARPAAAYWTLRVFMLGMVALVAWSAVGKIDQVTRASAQVIAPARTQLVQAADGGVITELHVHEGEQVKAGQILATLQKARASAAVADSEAKVAALRITLTRLHAEVYGKPLVFAPELQAYTEYIRNQTDLYTKRRQAIDDDLAALRSMLELADKELRINQQLVASGDVSAAEVLRIERSVADIRAQITNRRNKYFQDAQAEMTKAQEELASQTEQLRDRAQVLEHTELVAPAAGVVNNIRLNTVGGVIRAGEVLMDILPTGGELVVEAKVSPADIAFVAVGQPASVRLDAYDSAIYGPLKGEVSYVSQDVLTEETRQGPMPYYRARILVHGPDVQGGVADRIRLRPGMTGQVDIKARERTVLQFLTKPITKSLSLSLGER